MIVFQSRDILHFQNTNETFSKSEIGTYILARPKSIILILLVTLLTHKMFSGLKDQEK